MKNEGQFSFIIPNSITGVESAVLVRDFLLNQNQLNYVVNLLGETFAGVGVESCVLSAQKHNSNNQIKYLSVTDGNIDENLFVHVSPEIWRANRNFIFDITSSDEDSSIIKKIKQKSEILLNYYDVKVGLQAYEKGKGKPKQTEEDVKKHVFDYTHKYDDVTFPYLGGSDIARYKISWSGQWLRYGEWLSQPKTLDQFSKPRILIREITGKYPTILQAMLVDDVYLNNKSILNVLKKRDDYSLEFLLGYLNSKLISFYHKRQTVKGNRNLFPKIVVKDLQNYPIPPKGKEINEIGKVVTKILDKKTSNKEIIELESKVNQLVYQLYDLTEEEIKIVEGN